MFWALISCRLRNVKGLGNKNDKLDIFPTFLINHMWLLENRLLLMLGSDKDLSAGDHCYTASIFFSSQILQKSTWVENNSIIFLPLRSILLLREYVASVNSNIFCVKRRTEIIKVPRLSYVEKWPWKLESPWSLGAIWAQYLYNWLKRVFYCGDHLNPLCYSSSFRITFCKCHKNMSNDS